MNKKIKKQKVILLFIVILVVIIILPTFSRYIYNNIKESYLNSKQFYFTSDLLNVNNNKVSFSNWGGNTVYSFEFNVNSKLNELTKVNYDMNYELTCTIVEKDKATLFIDSENGNSTEGKEDGTVKIERSILSSQNTDPVKVYIRPKQKLPLNTSLTLKLKAVTTEPYKKEILATVKIIIGITDTDYTIVDSVNSEYAVLNLVNSNKDTTTIKISYDPDKIRIDLTDELFDLNNLVSNLTDLNSKQWTRTLDSTQKYIKEVKFYLKGQSSKKIKFYKIDRTIDYTYPNTDENSYSFNNGSILKIMME